MQRRTWLRAAVLSGLAGMAPKAIFANVRPENGPALGVVALGGAGVRIVQATRFDPIHCREPVLIASLSKMGRILKECGSAPKLPRVRLLVAGLGGGTGATLAPALAEWFSRSGDTVHAFVVWPFEFEGAFRLRRARRATGQLADVCETVRIFRNESLFDDPRDASECFETLLRLRTTNALRDYHQRLLARAPGDFSAI